MLFSFTPGFSKTVPTPTGIVPPVTLDAVSSAATTIAATTLTWAHTCAASAKLVVGIAILTDTPFISGVTYNGVAMTNFTDRSLPLGAGAFSTWKLTNPASGTHNIVVTANTTATMDAGGISFSGGGTMTSSDSTSSTGTGATAAITLTDTTALSMSVVMIAAVTTSATPVAPLTERWDEDGSALGILSWGGTVEGVQTNLSVTLAASVGWSIAGITVQPA